MLAALGLGLIAWPDWTVSAGSSAKARGAELFADKGCAHCHGTAGVGGGLGPDLQLVRKRMDAATLTKQIHDGGMGMPAFGNQLDEQQLKDLVAYLRAKRKFVVVPAEPVVPKANDKDPD
jgi:mono/diheme cytochrome c family protein